MRRNVQVLLAIIMLSVAVLIIIDSQRIVDTGTGNGAAILWDNEFENFVSSLSEDCRSDMEKVTVYREWIIQNISYDYSCNTLFYQTFDVNTVLQKRTGVCFDSTHGEMYCPCGMYRQVHSTGCPANGTWPQTSTRNRSILLFAFAEPCLHQRFDRRDYHTSSHRICFG